MAQRPAVSLSDLPGDTEHLVREASHQGTCVVYMKLTEACVKAIDTLLARKGAIDRGLRVQFNASGGTFAIPGVNSEKEFQFQTARIATKGTLECLHQYRQIQGRQTEHHVSNLGGIHHRLTIKATDEVYETTKTKAFQAEEERKESRVQQIKLPSRSSRKPKPYERSSNEITSHLLKVPKKTEATSTPNSTSLRIIRDRVIHYLAMKPHRKVDLHNRLKKDKSCELLVNHLDHILPQVADLQSNSLYTLKRSFYSEVKVESFPKYSDSERAAVKQVLIEMGLKTETAPGLKRSGVTENATNVTKRTKPSPSCPSHTTHALQQKTKDEPITVPPAATDDLNLTLEAVTSKDTEHKKTKRPKKHKQLKVEESSSKLDVTEPRPPDEDCTSAFQQITSTDQRLKYKEQFNADYEQYLQLKAKIDQVTLEFEKLREQLASCPKKSDEYKRISRVIKKKYTELQKDEGYAADKERYQMLCGKLSHIKKLVVQYDNSLPHSNNS